MDFLKENDAEIIRNILDPEHFERDSFEVVNVGFDVKLIVGILKDQGVVQWALNPDNRAVQGVKFKKPTWTMDAALDWLKSHQKEFKQSLELVKKAFSKKGHAIKGVEVFSVGTHNGDTFNTNDLDDMVSAFKDTGKQLPPPLKLGHDDDQKLLQADGLPAAGWIDKLYRNGDKLFADFRDIPDKVFQLIEKGAYRKVSIELYSGLEIMKKKYAQFISAISLLGADMPAVQNLGDILARYDLKDYDSKLKAFTEDDNEVKVYAYNVNQKTDKGGYMPDLNHELATLKVEKTQLLDKLAKLELTAGKYKAQDDDKTKEIEQIKQDLETTRNEFKAQADLLKVAEIDKQVAELEGAGLISPALKPFIKNLLDADKKEYSIKIKDDDKKLSKFDLIKETLKLAKATDVNFEDNSLDNDGETSKFSQKALDKKINTYAQDNKCDYATAYKAVMIDIEVPTATIESDED